MDADMCTRFLSVDPIGRKFPELTPYQFVGNTPIQAIDLDGLEPEIVITNQTGYAWQMVYGKAGMIMIVPTYKALIKYFDKGTEYILGETNVTRDAWFNLGDGQYVNRTFEPATDESGHWIEVKKEYTEKYGAGSPAYKLPQSDAVPQNSEWNKFTDGTDLSIPENGFTDAVRSDLGKVNDAMLHVGAIYELPDGTFKLAGSYGCFGVVEPSQVFKTRAAAQSKINEIQKLVSTEKPKDKPSMTRVSNEEMKRINNLVNKYRHYIGDENGTIQYIQNIYMTIIKRYGYGRTMEVPEEDTRPKTPPSNN